MKTWMMIFCLSAFTQLAAAKLPKADWQIKSGTLTYHVHYPVKNFVGTAKNVKGKGKCEAGHCHFLIAVPVKDFTSGDGNRDNHMLEVTKGATFTMVTVRVQFAENDSLEKLEAKAVVEFAGQTHIYEKLPIKVTIAGAEAVTQGQVPLKLSHFGVERPSLFAVEIDDLVPVDFELHWL
ncbi:MAG: YceI family protein [Bdellovibrionales bacterium]